MEAELKRPNHIAIIPDGNRRWAKERNLAPWKGHEAGVTNFRKAASFLFANSVSYLTFWALSIDNLKKRTSAEIAFLIKLMRDEFGSPSLLQELMEDGVKISFVGKWRELIDDKSLHDTIDRLELKTAENSKSHLTILLAYDGKTEMLEAIKKCGPDPSEDELKSNLWTGTLPSVDLAIRTGGEPHWSGGFMMWLTADTQFHFTETKWPDFGQPEIIKCLDEFAGRERRLGK